MRSTPIGIKPSTSPRTKTGAAAKKNGRRAFGPPFFRADSTRRTSHPKTTTRRCGHLKLPHLPSSPAELSTFRLVGQVRRRPKSLRQFASPNSSRRINCRKHPKVDRLLMHCADIMKKHRPHAVVPGAQRAVPASLRPMASSREVWRKPTTTGCFCRRGGLSLAKGGAAQTKGPALNTGPVMMSLHKFTL